MPAGMVADQNKQQDDGDRRHQATLFALGHVVKKIEALAQSTEKLAKATPTETTIAGELRRAIDNSGISSGMRQVSKSIAEMSEAEKSSLGKVADSISKVKATDLRALSDDTKKTAETLQMIQRHLSGRKVFTYDSQGRVNGSRTVQDD